MSLDKLVKALALVCVLLLTAPSSVRGEEDGGDEYLISNEKGSASEVDVEKAAEKMSQMVNPEMLKMNGGKKTFGADDAEIADMNLKLQQVFFDKVRRRRHAHYTKTQLIHLVFIMLSVCAPC